MRAALEEKPFTDSPAELRHSSLRLPLLPSGSGGVRKAHLRRTGEPVKDFPLRERLILYRKQLKPTRHYALPTENNFLTVCSSRVLGSGMDVAMPNSDGQSWAAGCLWGFLAANTNRQFSQRHANLVARRCGAQKERALRVRLRTLLLRPETLDIGRCLRTLLDRHNFATLASSKGLSLECIDS